MKGLCLIFPMNSAIRYESRKVIDNSDNACFGRKAKLVRESGDFAENRETKDCFGGTRDNYGTLQ